MSARRELKMMTAEVRRLMNQMAEVQVSKKRKGRKRRRRTKGGMLDPTPVMVSSRGGVNPGEITICRQEALASLVMAKGKTEDSWSKYLHPDTGSTTSQFPWLSGLAKMFDRYRWNKLHIYWKPAVSAMVSGQIAFGVDWNANLSSITMTNVTSLTPSVQAALWNDTSAKVMVLPAQLLQSMKWYKVGSGDAYDHGPGQLRIYATADSLSTDRPLGTLWADYSVTLQGTGA